MDPASEVLSEELDGLRAGPAVAEARLYFDPERAVGILADPQHALDLMAGREGAAPSRDPGGSVNLFVHVRSADLAAQTGAVSIERLGAATTGLLGEWLARHTSRGAKIIVRPVLTHASTSDFAIAVDQHDPPAAIRELVIQREAHCVFPGCRRDSRVCDLDHITAYLPLDEGGPPGQTRPGNLAPLCRTHHRAKTHTAWDYERLDEGIYTWTSPTGHRYDIATTPRARAEHPSG